MIRILAIALLAPVVLVALLFVAPAYAKTVLMECQKVVDAEPSHWKYKTPPIGKAKVFYRKDGNWIRHAYARVEGHSFVVERTDFEVADKDYPVSNLKKGDEYQEHYKWVRDITSLKYTRTWYMTKMDGSPLVLGKEGHDRAKPDIKERLCKKPNESWEDRRNG